jgi:hypothetical protein
MYWRSIQSGPRTEAILYATAYYKSTTLHPNLSLRLPFTFSFLWIGYSSPLWSKAIIFAYYIYSSNFPIVRLLWCYLGIDIDARRVERKIEISRIKKKRLIFSVSNRKFSQGFKPIHTQFPSLCAYMSYEYIFKHAHSTIVFCFWMRLSLIHLHLVTCSPLMYVVTLL